MLQERCSGEAISLSSPSRIAKLALALRCLHQSTRQVGKKLHGKIQQQRSSTWSVTTCGIDAKDAGEMRWARSSTYQECLHDCYSFALWVAVLPPGRYRTVQKVQVVTVFRYC
jgi:hypothetical protein